MNARTTFPLGSSTNIELILRRLGELVAELDGLCQTLQSEQPPGGASAQNAVTRRLQPESTMTAETVATVEIVDARQKGGGSPASERIVSVVLPGLLTGVAEVRVSCSIHYDRSQAGE
jgi:hypothetical protein